MRDRFGRTIECLRVSVTDNCNLRCIYCRPEENSPEGNSPEGNSPEDNSAIENSTESVHDILTPWEFGTIAGTMAELGVWKVRITGGEPLVRPDICEIVGSISKVPGITDLSMTTNGILLGKLADKLKDAGLGRLNISLDSLKEERFKSITRGGRLQDVMEGIRRAMEVKLQPVRINVVLMKGINDDEVDDFFALARDNPLDVRFIELMPVGRFGEQNTGRIVYNDGILASHPGLVHCGDDSSGQPASYYSMEGFKGRIGFISPIGHRFCAGCNRIRLTCDGKIRLCLGQNEEISIVDVLRRNPGGLMEYLKGIIYRKPEGHNFAKGFTSSRNMNSIGG